MSVNAHSGGCQTVIRTLFTHSNQPALLFGWPQLRNQCRILHLRTKSYITKSEQGTLRASTEFIDLRRKRTTKTTKINRGAQAARRYGPNELHCDVEIRVRGPRVHFFRYLRLSTRCAVGATEVRRR